jgi:hypothetical protein
MPPAIAISQTIPNSAKNAIGGPAFASVGGNWPDAIKTTNTITTPPTMTMYNRRCHASDCSEWNKTNFESFLTRSMMPGARNPEKIPRMCESIAQVRSSLVGA